jgi:hypothetical protein
MNSGGGGGGGGGKVKIPKPQKFQDVFKQGVNTWQKWLPRMVDQENQFRQTTDPQRIQQQQQLQAQFGPTQAKQQLAQLNALAPGYSQAWGQGLKNVQGIANTPSRFENAVNKQYPGQQQYANQTMNQAGKYTQQQLALLNPQLQAQQQAANQYKPIMNQLAGQVGQGWKLPPAMMQEVQNEIRAAQAARGNTEGPAAISAEGAFTGKEMQNLYNQRLQNYLSGSSGQQAALGGVQNVIGQMGQARQTGLGLRGAALQGAQAAMQPLQQAQQSQLARQQMLQGYLGSPNPVQQVGQIAPVSPDRSFQYFDPNAGYQAANYSSGAYQAQLGNALNSSRGGGSSPWGAILGTAATVAPALISAFSDKRLKKNIKETGESLGGHKLYSYDVKVGPNKGQHQVGVIAQEVERKDPSAVVTDPTTGYKAVNYGKLYMEN